MKKNTFKIISLIFLLLSISLFQNCESNHAAFNVSEAELASQGRGIGENSILINNGSEFTTNTTVVVTVFAKEPTAMYFTNDATCESGGQWEPIAREKTWELATPNALNSVYVKFKKNTEFEEYSSDCVSASITHDNIAPSISFKEKPDEFEGTIDAKFAFQSVEALSGIQGYECKLVGERLYESCEDVKTYEKLTEGAHSFQVRALDRAGNRSDTLEYSWTVDLTAPTLAITAKPDAISASSVAVFEFDVEDHASGVAESICSIDGVAAKACVSPVSFPGLGEGNHSFSVQTMDKVGNKSAVLTYSWKVQGASTTDFQILGVTGGADTVKDKYLGSILQPTVHWTASAGASSYKVSILNSAATSTICPEVTTSAVSQAFSSCTLVNGTKYKVRVAAFTNAGAIKVASLFEFLVDIVAPVITASAPVISEDQKQAVFSPFSIVDALSGMQSSSCVRKFGTSASTVANCHTLTKLTFNELVTGDHQLVISAADKAGNKSTKTINFVTKKVICDPFSKSGIACRQGWKGEIRYYQGEGEGYKTLAPYFSEGVDANAILYMSKIFVPTRTFSNGFPTTDGELLKKKAIHGGANLLEWFALRLNTIMKLKATDGAGYYQFALISDDGSKLYFANNKTAPYNMIIDNDNFHPARMKCTTTAVYMDANTRMPARLEYFQGPRTQIALTLMFRKVSSANAPLAGPCDVTDSGFIGGVDNTSGIYTGSPYQDALDKGWKLMETDNFLLDETIGF